MTREDKIHLEAAEGWIELGDHISAFEELESIQPQNRAHPHVLALRWHIFRAGNSWVAAEAVARGLMRTAPDKFEGYWMRSFALHVMGRTQEAHDNLAAVRDKFAEEWLLHYNCACYLSRLGHLDEARKSLAKALALNPKIRAAAAADPDLDAMWTEIQRAR